jgi:hypothetical protein
MLLISGQANGQQRIKKLEFTDHLGSSKANSDQDYLVITGYPTTGIVLSCDSATDLGKTFLVAAGDTLYLSEDEHNEGGTLTIYSNLITFSEPIDKFYFHPGAVDKPVNFLFIDARMSDEVPQKPAAKKKSAGCSEPVMTDQSEWRAGLDPPDYIRIETQVHNLIIHHTAGSNTDTNYVQVVRNIYIYHTQGRGWSDIGYNYLIAQDGTIFKGRDPEPYEQDNVVGAHFCAANSRTMGVSLLGTYTDIAPPDTVIQSLVQLLTWKSGKDSLDPIGTSPHALNFTLDVVSGHRDGCATECPGSALYLLLPEIRNNIYDLFNDCAFAIKPLAVAGSEYEGFKVILHDRLIELQGLSPDVKPPLIYNLLGQPIRYTVVSDSGEKLLIEPSCNRGILLIISVPGRMDIKSTPIYF